MSDEKWMDDRKPDTPFNRRVSNVRSTQFRMQALQQKQTERDFVSGTFAARPLQEPLPPQAPPPQTASSAQHFSIPSDYVSGQFAGRTPPPQKPQMPEPQVYTGQDMAPSRAFGAKEVVREMTDDEIDERAFYDQQTGTWNLRYFVRRLQYEVGRANYFARPLALLCVSIDGFKALGMEFGPLALDKSIENLVLTLFHNTRPVDMIGRYGEARFLVLLPELNREQVSQLCEHVRQSCQNTVITHQWHNFRLSVSIGVVLTTPEIEDVESLIAIADLGADMVTERGGNGFCFAAEAV